MILTYLSKNLENKHKMENVQLDKKILKFNSRAGSHRL